MLRHVHAVKGYVFTSVVMEHVNVPNTLIQFTLKEFIATLLNDLIFKRSNKSTVFVYKRVSLR